MPINECPCDPFLNRRVDSILGAETKAQSLIEESLSDFSISADRSAIYATVTIYALQPGGFQRRRASCTRAQALKQGVAHVTISLATSLDTHDETWATDHPVLLQDGFTLSALVDDLGTLG